MGSTSYMWLNHENYQLMVMLAKTASMSMLTLWIKIYIEGKVQHW